MININVRYNHSYIKKHFEIALIFNPNAARITLILADARWSCTRRRSTVVGGSTAKMEKPMRKTLISVAALAAALTISSPARSVSSIEYAFCGFFPEACLALPVSFVPNDVRFGSGSFLAESTDVQTGEKGKPVFIGTLLHEEGASVFDGVAYTNRDALTWMQVSNSPDCEDGSGRIWEKKSFNLIGGSGVFRLETGEWVRVVFQLPTEIPAEFSAAGLGTICTEVGSDNAEMRLYGEITDSFSFGISTTSGTVIVFAALTPPGLLEFVPSMHGATVASFWSTVEDALAPPADCIDPSCGP